MTNRHKDYVQVLPYNRDLPSWIESFVDLQRAFYTLNQAKKDSEHENYSRNPERVPLNSLSPVVPPL
jgi:hypothetical protein